MKPIITTKQGAVQGTLSQDGKALIFRGVPYAQPPVGSLRFARPQEHEPWEGPRDCTQFSPRCPQCDLTAMDFYSKEFYDEMVPPEDEDCLYLNAHAAGGLAGNGHLVRVAAKGSDVLTHPLQGEKLV